MIKTGQTKKYHLYTSPSFSCQAKRLLLITGLHYTICRFVFQRGCLSRLLWLIRTYIAQIYDASSVFNRKVSVMQKCDGLNECTTKLGHCRIFYRAHLCATAGHKYFIDSA